MPDFTELNVDGTNGNDGVTGDYRMNRHRIYFCKTSAPRPYAVQLFQNFPQHFNQKAAEVKKGAHKHHGQPTFEFSGYIDLSEINDNLPETKDASFGAHDDWVAVKHYDKSRGFTAQTLKRNYLEAGEKAARAAADTSWHKIDDAAIEKFISVNQYHFLAGRRSWVIGPACEFDHDIVPSDIDTLMVFETAAIERVSRWEYLPGAKFFDKQTKVIWATLLRNYVQNMGLQRQDHRPWAGCTQKDGVSFVYKHVGTKDEMIAASRKMCRIHRNLWPSANTS